MPAPARSVVAGSGPPRVLLVHANPFQRVTPVPAYGLERLRTAIEPTGAEVELLDPYLVSEDPLGAARAAAERFRPDVIGLGIRIIDDCIVVDRLEAPADEPIDVSFLLPEILELRGVLAAAAPQATFIAGGAGFSACPQECLEFLGVEHGVVGAGEAALAAVCEGQSLDEIPGVIRRGQAQGIAAYRLDFGGPTRREPLYAPANSFPVRTRIGCAMQCVYCTAANLGRQHANGDLETVLDEVEQTVQAARERGVGRVSIFFADDEFNLPDERHPISVLEGLRDRGLAKHLTWRAYFNPTPFSAEFAELVRETNGHVSITVDSAADSLLETAQKPFRRRHLDDLVALLSEHGVSADLGLIFGLPGETEETIAETIAFVRALPLSVEVVYSAGARVYPHTPLVTDRRAGAGASRRRRRSELPDPVRLLVPVASTRAGALGRRAAFESPEREPGRSRLSERPDDPFRRVPRSPGPTDFATGCCKVERKGPLGRDPRPSGSGRLAAEVSRDDRRLYADRDLARTL